MLLGYRDSVRSSLTTFNNTAFIEFGGQRRSDTTTQIAMAHAVASGHTGGCYEPTDLMPWVATLIVLRSSEYRVSGSWQCRPGLGSPVVTSPLSLWRVRDSRVPGGTTCQSISLGAVALMHVGVAVGNALSDNMMCTCEWCWNPLVYY